MSITELKRAEVLGQVKAGEGIPGHVAPLLYGGAT
jgi:hypothetical protein